MTQPLFSIGLVADCQYADADPLRLETPPGSGQMSVTRFYRLSKAKLREAIGVFDEAGVDAIINLGDLVDREVDDIESLTRIWDGAQAPVWSVAGNHDFAGWPVPPSAVFDSLQMPAPYYAKSINGFRLLFLDSNEVGQIEHPPGSPEHHIGTIEIERIRAANRPNAFDWNGGIGEKQLGWIQRQLLTAHSRGERVILVSHHPFYPASTHNLLNDLEFCEIVRSHSEIVAAFSGHNHDGNFGALGTVQCLTLHGMVEREDNSFAIARFFHNRIELQGFGREVSTVLPIAIASGRAPGDAPR